MRNCILKLALKVKKNTQIGLYLNVVRIDRDGCLKLRDCLSRVVCAQILLSFFDMRRKFLLLVFRRLRSTKRHAQQQNESRGKTTEVRIHIVQIISSMKRDRSI